MSTQKVNSFDFLNQIGEQIGFLDSTQNTSSMEFTYQDTSVFEFISIQTNNQPAPPMIRRRVFIIE